MPRTFPAVFVVVLALAACSRKDEPVVAAPLSSPAPAAGAAPAAAPEDELPSGHPPLDGAVPGAGMGEMPPAPPHGAAMSAGPAEGDVKVEKAKGKDARTVAEVFAQRASLKGKTVTVRGKVVRYNAGIMGKNWIHLRDGTGAAGTNDVTVTTQDAAQKGEVVTVQGTVAVDHDIGMGGTPYPVVIEDAKVSR